MKFVIADRVKNQLMGLLVLISLAVIFLPPMIKKANHRFDEKISASLKLPTPPRLPKVAIPSQKAMFQKVKVAHIEVPALARVQRATQLAKAEPLVPSKPAETREIAMKKPDMPKQPQKEANVGVTKQLAAIEPRKPVSTPHATIKSTVVAAHLPLKSEVKKVVQKKSVAPVNLATDKSLFAVQLASFTQQSNAKQLVARLKQKGYTASYNKFMTQHGDEYYQVLVGKLAQKDDALHLQKKLVSHMQLSGIIVRTSLG